MTKQIGASFHGFNSAIYQGTTYHKRFTPKIHAFSYPIYFLWLDLDEIPLLHQNIKYLSSKKYSIASFNEADYQPDDFANIDQPELMFKQTLKQNMINKAYSLGEKAQIDQVFLLGQIRTWGLYFSPVNFYYLYQQGRLISILAQVSNTPWNEKHYYLVPFQANTYICDKEFHVSPFNNLDMQYAWKTSEPSQNLNLHIENIKDGKLFHAGISLKRQALNNKNFNRLLIKFPWMCVKTIFAIYWQAVKLWLKGIPFYGYVEHKK
ncbi:DUF1365 domain-containing protein [Catenovulum adriaticum]|uniref:DUF1365 domain-containing protein n=1 Tax=Catenovulum adriaticum TaxID=2984846 RepID=A0ABY7AS48_9ALTE|nr:DUF1365 domain-containing protein [Catenovulum sp. TS8]WAJ71491.1 DUF1365 domain-containing protein [Catenovulum sp. TS8]